MSLKTAAIYDRWLSTLGGGEQVAFAYAQILTDLGYKVDLLTQKKVDINKAEKKMGVSLEKITIKYLEKNSNKYLSEISKNYDVFINNSHLDYFPNYSKLGILSIFFPGSIKLSPGEYLKRAFFIPFLKWFFTYPESIDSIPPVVPNIRFFLHKLFKKYFPRWEMRLHGGPGVIKLSDINSYHHLVTISKFCQKWINHYWGLESKVLYPPVNTANFNSSQPKKNQIIHVGRFFVTGHSKKQLEMIRLFKELIDDLKTSDWTLHLVGSVESGINHQKYFEQCQLEAKNYPIHFHTATSFKELRNLLAQSKIYWHATGLDEKEEKNPIVFEHFGITTVEAMASGCVPVVINAGGQPEIVTPENGFCWNNREEWLMYTKKLMTNEKLLNKLKGEAIKRSQYFSHSNFKKRFKEIIKNY